MYAVFKTGYLVDLTEDSQSAADQISAGTGDKLRKVNSLEDLADVVKLEQANACCRDDDHAGKEVLGMFNELRAELERGAKRLFEQVRTCERGDFKQQAKETLEKVRRNGMTALDELRRKIHQATADKQEEPEEPVEQI